MGNQAFLDPTPNCLPPTATAADAMRVMTDTGVQIILVVDGAGRLLGVVVDSDIRRSLLRTMDLSVPVADIMNPRPTTLPAAASRDQLQAAAANLTHALVPLVNADGRVKGLVNIWRLQHEADVLPNAAVIMAGGEGRRLRPLTLERPKPMIEIGGRPILEIIIRHLADEGIRRFYLSVNYLAQQIIDHCGDGTRWGVSIEYIHEDQPLGTAGALAALREREQLPVLVTNGDILTRLRPRALFDFHRQEKARATMVVRSMSYAVPYGVVEVRDNHMIGIREKPVYEYFVNAGVYVVEPEVIDMVVPGQSTDMPTLLSSAHAAWPGGVACFPIPEYWADIGQPDDLARVKSEFAVHFND